VKFRFGILNLPQFRNICKCLSAHVYETNKIAAEIKLVLPQFKISVKKCETLELGTVQKASEFACVVALACLLEL
jgi:hypothetical protein